MFDFKLFRKQKGLSQADMADILNLSQASYSRIETGNWVPSDDKLNEYMQNIKMRFSDFNQDRYLKPDKETTTTQRNVFGPNYIGRLEKQSDEDRFNLRQIVETLRNELEEKNVQIREKDAQINSLLAIIASNNNKQ